MASNFQILQCHPFNKPWLLLHPESSSEEGVYNHGSKTSAYERSQTLLTQGTA